MAQTFSERIEKILWDYLMVCLEIYCQSKVRKIKTIPEAQTQFADQIKLLLKEVVDESRNPYPEDIFVEPTKKQYVLFHRLLQKEGLTLDKFSGAIGRSVWKAVLREIRRRIEA